ncbi:hypothetical protein F5Y15DRAFT_409082 [Xylariaceae sp. FL0016]|nr:hypothetical protein F5Y15DRAFT_409082 [Xylariaceae sp. FL0016]
MSQRGVCRHFFSRGECRFGQRCKFTHVQDYSRRMLRKQGQGDPLRIEWDTLLRQANTAQGRPTSTAADRIFPLALQLVEGDLDSFQASFKKLASEAGLSFIRYLAKRCSEVSKFDITELRLWNNQIQPLFKLLSHPRVIDSAILEQEVAIIYNFFIGIGGSRMQHIYDFVIGLLALRGNQPAGLGSRMSVAEVSLSVLSKIIDCNTNNVISESFASIAERFSAVVLEPVDESDEFSKLQAQKFLAYVNCKLGEGKTIPSHRPTERTPADRAEFVLRQDLPGHLSAAGRRHDNDHVRIQDIRILPTEDEIASDRAEYLPTNVPSQFHLQGIHGRLDREFRLLREDTVGQLRDAVRAQIEAMKNPETHLKKSTLRVFNYQHPIVHDLQVGKLEGVEIVVRFLQPAQRKDAQGRKQWWMHSKRLQPNSLVCIVSETGSALFFVVTQSTLRVKDEKKAREGRPESNEPNGERLTLSDDDTFSYVYLKPAENKSSTLTETLQWYQEVKAKQRRCLVEFPGVLLPSFQHTLEALQKMSQNPRMPFSDLIAPRSGGTGSVHVRPPQYSTRAGFKFDLSAITTDHKPFYFSPSHQQGAEDLSQQSSLDPTQAVALLNTLERELSLIQGPPGTGKSYVGEKIIKILLSNKGTSRLGPVVCVCYTNHALDQLLEHLLDDGITQIIRIGSRSKSEKLEKLNLRVVAQGAEKSKSEKRDMWLHANALEIHQETVSSLFHELRCCRSPSSLKAYLDAHYPHHHNVLFGSQEDAEGFHMQRKSPQQSLQNWLKQGNSSNTSRSRTVLLEANLDTLTQKERHKLHAHWMQDIRDPIIQAIKAEVTSFICNQSLRDKVREEVDLRCLKGADIIGVTTTGLARHLDLFGKLGSKVMLCEEAGEVLEAHTLTAILPSVEHAIFIGDHLQLRPQIQNYELQSTNPRGMKYSLDVSLFERLVSPSVDSDIRLPYSMLETQRRMHPSISELVRSTLYPSLEDGEEVQRYPEVVGMKRRLFWLDHNYLEALSSDTDSMDTSHSNDFEIEFVTMLVSHLVRQGLYKSEEIAVITPYLGHLHRLRQRMSSLFMIAVNERDQADLDMLGQNTYKEHNHSTSQEEQRVSHRITKATLLESIRVATVDNFQGEEAKIVIISLVRSNPQNRCGFVSTSNRINVLLSRAQHGMYIIGNSTTYSHVPMWCQVLHNLREGGNLGTALELQCPRHPDFRIAVSEPDHFLQFSPEGGCNLRCDRRLDCGHTCIGRCHAEAIHDAVKCLEPCPRPKKGCQHSCRLACGDKCLPKCLEKLENINLALPCGHHVSSALCWEAQNSSAILCRQAVVKIVPGCQHSVRVPCHIDVEAEHFRCMARCNSHRPCGHDCKNPCHRCKERKADHVIRENHGHCEQICGRKSTTCQHNCSLKCHGDDPCPPCPLPCEVRCSHSKCNKPCNEPCAPCAEQNCASHCPHQTCTMPCAAPCDWVPCSRRCEKHLSCGHQCPSICGELCPSAAYCQQCCSDDEKSAIVDFIVATKYCEVDLDEDPCIFPDCGHFLTRSNMDGLMDLKAHYQLSESDIPIAISNSSHPFSMDEVKACPTCRGPLRNVARYGRLVRRAILDETTKKFITWSNIKFQELADRLIERHEQISNMPKPDVLLGTKSASSGKTILHLSRSRQTQLEVVRNLVKDRYKPLFALWRQIHAFESSVSREEQPFQRVADFVQHAQRQHKTEGRFSFDDTTIQVKGHLQATALLLRCESVIFNDFVQVYRNVKDKPHVKIDLSQHLQDCCSLVASAQTTHYPRQEVEGHIYYVQFCAIARALTSVEHVSTPGGMTPSGMDPEALKANGEAHLQFARLIMEEYPSTILLEPRVTAAEKLLNEGVFYSAVSETEMRDVYRAMTAELRGTGHWYTCVNGHPFTVGECGMPMELARCPECDSPVGGQNHQAAQGVRHAAEVDQLARDVTAMAI